MFIVLVAVGLLATLRPGTPEFAVTLLTLLIGVLFLAILAVTLVQLVVARLWVYYEAEQPIGRGAG